MTDEQFIDEVVVALIQWAEALDTVLGLHTEVKHVLVLGEFDVHEGDCADTRCELCGCCKHCSTQCPCIADGCDNRECMCGSLENG